MSAAGKGRLAAAADIPVPQHGRRSSWRREYLLVDNEIRVDPDLPPFSHMNGRFELRVRVTARALSAQWRDSGIACLLGVQLDARDVEPAASSRLISSLGGRRRANRTAVIRPGRRSRRASLDRGQGQRGAAVVIEDGHIGEKKLGAQPLPAASMAPIAMRWPSAFDAYCSMSSRYSATFGRIQ